MDMLKLFKNANVTATVRDEKGNITQVVRGHNTVSTSDPASDEHNGYFYILNRIFDFGDVDYPEYDPDDFINKMQIGTGTPDETTPNGLGVPLTSVPSTTLIPFASGYPSEDLSTLAAPIFTVQCDWGSDFNALSGVSEVGLFADGTGKIMVAHKTFTPNLSKTTGGTLSITWEITLSA